MVRLKKMRKVIALVISIVMIISVQISVAGISFEGTVTENVPALKNFTQGAFELNSAQKIVGNSKYLFVAIGMKGQNWRANSAVQVYDKATGELLTTISQVTTSSSWYCPVRDMYVDDDVLYISWGNAIDGVSGGKITCVTRAASYIQAPVIAYDVSEVIKDTAPKKLRIDNGNAWDWTLHAPYVWGGISYLDETNGKYYTSKVLSKNDGIRTYTIYETSNVPDAISQGSSSGITKKSFHTTGLSMNAAQFIIKDGWLFEVLQQNGGLVDVTSTNSLVDSEGNVMNNTVRVYDLNSVMDSLTSTSQSVTSCLKGVYTTEETGRAVIRDIEVYGDYMYLATPSGIEVVSLEAAKEEGVTSSDPAVLSKVSIIAESGKGGVMDVAVEGGILFGGYTGTKVYASPNSTSDDGAIVMYNLGENAIEPTACAKQTVAYGVCGMDINDATKKIYVLKDTMGPASMSACTYKTDLASFVSGALIGDKVTENIPTLTNLTKNNCSALGESTQTLNSAQKMVENSKYLFVAIGAKGQNWRANSAVQVYDKLTGELLTTITQASSHKEWYCPVRDMYVDDDVLYISWGNAIDGVSGGKITCVTRAASYVQAPVVAYDVSEVTKDTAPKKLRIDSGNAWDWTIHAPYVWGGISYLDETNGKYYTSKVLSKSDGIRTYIIYETSDVPDAIEANSGSGITKKSFHTTGLSMNAAQFIIKDGWLFEVLQQNGGLEAVTATNSLVDSEGNAINNTVRVYDLNSVMNSLSSTSQSVASCLKGIYTTEETGRTAIRDIEVYGDYMYLATPSGIEVVSLSAAKAEGITSSNPADLSKTGTITESGKGGVLDLELNGNILYSGYTGPQVYSAPNSTSEDGAVVAYDLSTSYVAPQIMTSKTVTYGVCDMSVNVTDGKVYVLNDTMGPASMSAYEFDVIPISLVSESGLSAKLTAGTYEISAMVNNPDSLSGVVICALYSGNALSDVLVKPYSSQGKVVVSEEYEIDDDITKIKMMYFSDIANGIRPLGGSIEMCK